MLGYKVELYMNTAYICVIYAVMLFLLGNTDDPIEIILNALAIEFVHSIDEELSVSEWYDPGERWISAGAMELVLRSELRLDYLRNPSKLSLHFDIPMDAMKEELGTNLLGQCNSLRNASLARKDEVDPEFAFADDKQWLAAAAYAQKRGNAQAVLQYRKPHVTFGAVEWVWQMCQLTKRGLFRRYPQYYAWSSWDKLLFMCRLPGDEGCNHHLASVQFDLKEQGVVPAVKLSTRMPSLGGEVLPMLNYSSTTDSHGWVAKFAADVLSTLSGAKAIASIYTAVDQRKYHHIPFRIVDGILHWVAYLIQILFPPYVFGYILMVLYCY